MTKTELNQAALVGESPTSVGRFRRRLHRLPPAVRVTATLVITQAIVAAAALVNSTLAAVVMSPSDRGLLALWLQVVYLLAALAVLGTDRPIIARATRGHADSLRDQLSVLRFPLISAAVGTVVLAALAAAGFSSALLLSALVVAGTLAGKLIRTAYIVSRRSRWFWISVLATQALLIAGTVLLWQRDESSPTVWLGVYAVATAANLVLLILAGRQHDEGSPLTADAVRDVRRAGYRLIPASLGNTAMLRSDRLLLPILDSTRSLGIYIVVATIMEMASWPVQNYVDASLRRWRIDLETGVLKVRHLMIRIGSVAFAVIAGCAVLSAAIVVFLLSSAYRESLPLIPVLAAAALIYSVSRVLIGLLVAKGEGSAASRAETVGMVVAVVAYVGLIPMMGPMGAALGSVIGYAAGLATAAVVLRRSKGAVQS